MMHQPWCASLVQAPWSVPCNCYDDRWPYQGEAAPTTPTVSPDQGRGKPDWADHIANKLSGGIAELEPAIAQTLRDLMALRAQPSASADTAELRRLADALDGCEPRDLTQAGINMAVELLRTAADSLDAARAELRARPVGIAEKHGKLLP